MKGKLPAILYSLQANLVWTQLAVIIFVLIPPRPAVAHLVTSGVGPFYDGVAHFFVSANDLLAVVALALFGGLSGKIIARQVAMLLPASWLGGMLAGYWTGPWLAIDGSWCGAGSLLICGMLLATNPKLPSFAFASLTIVVGGFHGALNGAVISATQSSVLTSLGIIAAATALGICLSAFAVSSSVKWRQIAIRVIGSWIAAIGLLSLAWQFRSST